MAGIGNTHTEVESSALSAGANLGPAQSRDPKALCREYLNQAKKDLRASRFEQAIILLQRIQSNPDSGFSRTDLAIVDYNLGNAYYRLGQYDEALSAYLSALEVYRDVNDRRLISTSLNGIGNVHYARDDFSNALQYYKEGMEFDEDLDDKPSMAVAYNNIGLVYGGLGDMQRAREFLTRSKAIREELGDTDGVAYCLNNLGYSWFLDKEYERALQLVQQSLALREQQGDLYGVVNALTLIARIYMPLNEFSAAISHLERALPIAREKKLPREQLAIYAALSEAFELRGDFAKALECHQEYHQRSREVFNAQSEERMQQLVVKHKLERAQYDKEMYRLQNEQLEMALHRKNDELATMALLLVQKAEMLNNFRQRLPELLQSNADQQPIDAALEEFDHILGLSKEWESFERGLQETHQDFVSGLAAKFPDLSPTELRLCTFIKLGLNNKDIAGLMNVGVRDIENHRYRMRRKFELRRQDKLDRYLLEYEKQLRRQDEEHIRTAGKDGDGVPAPHPRSGDRSNKSNTETAVSSPPVQTLSLRLPELSHMEVKVCSLLLRSMSSKEIADSLSLSVRTIERHRLRIRRKLGLGRQVNLTTYLASLG